MSATGLSLTPEVFTILSGLIEERVGIHYGPGDRDLVAHKVSGRALDAGFDSLLDYYYFLRYDPSSQREFQALVDELVVGETYFFREQEQLAVLVDSFVEPLVRAGIRARIWCAACATGEEPLTLAMILANRGLLEACRVVASDVSRRALERAKAGKFGSRALRRVPPAEFAQRWLREEDGVIQVDPELVQTIDWRQVNLCDAAAVKSIGPCDAIICRNVLIYFRDKTITRILTSFLDLLPVGGTLLVGVSESLLRFGGTLACEERQNVFMYRKREEQP
jgi:chemotaxis protein methyltransferase CheR